MNFRMFCCGALLCALGGTARSQPAPHLEKRGSATQLIVDGKPFLALAGELNNTVSSDLGFMKTVWPTLANQAHLNTVLAGVAWDWIEPEEGHYDFRIVDAALENARQNNLRLVWLWFASWKNGISSFAPAWVKANQDRFPRAQIGNGKSVEVLSTLSDNNREADARAFAALMRHIREIDATQRVIMVQVENEVGILGDSRDRSAAANEAFAKPVPQALLDYLTAHKEAAVAPHGTGTWEEVFGKGPQADEIFMAWNYARYINRVVEAGKKEYAIPMYVNAWIIQPQDKGPGDYPSGGPQAHMHGIWRAGAPAIDLLCPDIYLPDFIGITAQYTRAGNPLFVPESTAGVEGAANAFYAIGAHNAMGYSPFAVDRETADVAKLPLSVAYAQLAQLAPTILEHQAQGTIAAVSLNRQRPEQQVKLGHYILNAALVRSFRTPDAIPDVTGYGIFMAVAPDEYLVAGNNLQISFTPNTPGPPIAGLARQEAGHFENGRWVATRLLGGDDSMLRSDFANVVEVGQSGSGVRLRAGDQGMQRVRLYRYR